MTSRICLAAVLAAAVLVGGCGSDGGGGNGAPGPPPVAKPEDFPQPAGRSLAQIARAHGGGGPVLAASSSEFEPGKNRFGFGLFDRTRAQIADAPVAVYVASTGGGPAQGPFPARYESLAVKPQFTSRGVESDPDAARSVYVAQVEFERPGRYEVLGLARFDDRLVAATPAGGLRVVKDGRVPEVGERPRTIHTPTREDVSGDLAEIDTRQPPSSMHDADFADVAGKKPVVLLFATPALCQSRVCGPVVDIAEQVKADTDDDVEFIHMEIFNDNKIDNGLRPQVSAWNLQTEPWLFTLDRRGRIAGRIEGAFSADELERAIAAAKRG